MAVFPVHFAVQGRLRLRIVGLRSEPILKFHLEGALAATQGVRHVSASTLTGTLLVEYDPAELSAVAVAATVRTLLADPLPAEVSLPASAPAPARPRPVLRLVPSGDQKADVPWHIREGEDALRFFGTPPEGLSEGGCARQFARFGANALPRVPPRPGWRILLEQFRSLPVVLLGASAVVSLATGGIADALVILAVVGINAAIGYATESRAERTIHSLKTLVRPSALVRREGALRAVRSEEVVPGDLLVLRPGTYITADCRLIEEHHLTVDESILTGESLPVAKNRAVLKDVEIPLGDRTNMVFTGTFVVGGQGLGVVVATGNRTEIGRIQGLIGEAGTPATPMEQELERIGNRLVLLSGGICASVFLLGLLRGQGLLPMLKSSITLAVAAIPEGLPAVATSVLALGIGKMKRQGVLIRRLDAVETLGAVQTVCLDKTGTLTLNRMGVTRLQAGGRRIEVSGGRFFAEGKEFPPSSAPEMGDLLKVAVLCSETEIDLEEGRFRLNGSPTENALVETAVEAGIDVLALRRAYPLLHTVYRAEGRRLMSTVHCAEGEKDSPFALSPPEPGDGRRLLAVKGSPDDVLARCSTLLREGGAVPLGEEEKQAIALENEEMAGQGLRVLGVALALLEEEGRSAAARKLVWVGLVGMADPLRPGVKTLIERFHRAGIDTAMITGDQVPTAYAVGRDLHLQRDGQLEIFESTLLGEVDPELLGSLAKGVHIFARISPAQKLQIVQALQRGGRVVAMTGDGINDGPALKAADIGIAMGMAGTDLAWEVADVVLEDDRLETLMVAIEEGRAVYRNIRKSIRFLVATNLSEIMIMLAAVAGGQGHLLTPMQLLWINLVSDIFPGLALALEPPESDVLDRPPRDPAEPILSPAFLRRSAREASIISGGALGAYAYGIARYGAGPRAGTVGFLSLVCAQLLHTLSCRSEEHSSLFAPDHLPSNPTVSLAVGGSLFLQLLAVAVPGLRRFLGLTPVSLLDGAVVGATALLPLLVNEAIKGGNQEKTP